MSKYLIDSETLTDIADAIREQTGDSNPIAVSSMATQISSIVGGGSHSYSETEQEVGTWIDGSTIYEKTIILQSGVNLTKGSWTSVSAVTLSGDEDTFISTKAFLPSHKAWMSFAGKNDSGTFKIFSETAFTIQGVIIQYTKASASLLNSTESEGSENE